LLERRKRASLESLEDRTLLSVSAVADTFGLIENVPLNVGASGVLANDSTTENTALQVTNFTQPANGNLVLNPDGSFQYIPVGNFVGADSFTYTMSDGVDSATTTVNLTVADSIPVATVFAGSRLASIDSSEGPLLNAVTSALLQSNVSLSVLDWNGLAGGEVNLASLLDVLQADLGVSSPSEVLTTDLTLVQILGAAATVAQADGNTALVNALDAQILQLGGLTGTIQLGDLLQIDPNQGSLSDIDLNALDLVTGTAQLYNFDNVLTTPTPVVISGAELAGLGLPVSVGSLQLSAQVVEPPVIVRGPEGTQFHTAAMRVKLDLDDLVGLDLDTSGLLGAIGGVLGVPLNVITATANVADLQVYLEVASTNGTIQTIDAISAAVGVEATPGVTNIYVGNIDDSVFFNRTHVIDPATDLTFGTVGSLAVSVPLLGLSVSAAIQVRDVALGQAPGSPTLLNFTPPYPSPLQTVGSSTTFITNLAQSLVNNLEVQISGSLGPLLDGILPALTSGLVQPLVNSVLTPIVTPLLTNVADPLLGALGIGIGESIVGVEAVGIFSAPIANPDHANTDVDTAVVIPVLNNDAFAPGDTLQVSSVTQGTNGSVVINPDGTVTYTPNPGFVGVDSFTYVATNGTLLSNSATVTINILPPDQQPPVANADQYSMESGQTLSVVAPGVLVNDVSPSGTPLTATLVGQPTNGTVTFNTDGSLQYTPNAGFVGTDSFTYQASDGTNLTNLATVTITVLPPQQQPPVAVNDQFSVTENQPLTIAAPGVLSNDVSPSGLPLTAAIVDQPTNGTVTLNTDGSFQYTPNAGFVGTDSFTYQASDGTLTSGTATVAITVVAQQQQAPTAVNDQYSVTQNQALTIATPGVLGNDVSPSGTPLTATLVGQPTNGTVTLNTDGSFQYTPNAGFVGVDSFTYQASDGTLTSGTATVAITVVAQQQQAPTAVNDQYATNQGQSLTISAPGVLSNDVSTSGAPLTATIVGQPTNGTVTLNTDGSFQYTPNAGFVGVDSFTYQASDGTLTSGTATVAITVLAQQQQAPTAVDDQYVANEGGTLVITTPGVLINDSSPNGNPLTAEVVDPPSNGTLVLNPDGSFTYIPNPGFIGTDSFTYRNTDGVSFSNSASVAIAVLPVAPQPAPPSVIGLQRYGFHNQTTLLVLTFSQDLDPVRAQNPANYLLQSRGRDRRLGTRDDLFIPIVSAQYDASTRTVTLITASRQLKLRDQYQLTVIGVGATGLTGVTGIPLAGRPGGQPGTNYVTHFDQSILVGPSEVDSFGGGLQPRRGDRLRARQEAIWLRRQAQKSHTPLRQLGRLNAHRAASRPVQ